MHPILTGLSKARDLAASLPARFLVAEDDHELRFIIIHVLSQAFPSARIAAFANGKDALDNFDKNGANFVVSNHSMPVMNGPTFVRRLRERSDALPILMVSGSPEARLEGVKAGISFFSIRTRSCSGLPPWFASYWINLEARCSRNVFAFELPFWVVPATSTGGFREHG